MDDQQQPDRELAPAMDPRTAWGAGLALGVGVGLSIGSALGNPLLGLAIGLGIGVAFALAFGARKDGTGASPRPGPGDPGGVGGDARAPEDDETR